LRELKNTNTKKICMWISFRERSNKGWLWGDTKGKGSQLVNGPAV